MTRNSNPDGYQFTNKIVAHSVAKDWHGAKPEWTFVRMYIEDKLDRCLCGHAIRECCVLRNHLNGQEVVVGNCCVKKFLDLRADRLFAALKRIAADPTHGQSVALIEFAFKSGWIDSWQRKFSLDTRRKRKMSPNRRAKRVEINEQIIERSGWLQSN